MAVLTNWQTTRDLTERTDPIRGKMETFIVSPELFIDVIENAVRAHTLFGIVTITTKFLPW